jgi:hypothetical protein
MSFRYTKYKINFTHLWLKLHLLAFLLFEAQITAVNLYTIPSFTFWVSPVGISHTHEPSFSISPEFSIENTRQYGRCQYHHPAPYDHTVHYHLIYPYSSDSLSPTTVCLQQAHMSSLFFWYFRLYKCLLMSSAFLFVLTFSLAIHSFVLSHLK